MEQHQKLSRILRVGSELLVLLDVSVLTNKPSENCTSWFTDKEMMDMMMLLRGPIYQRLEEYAKQEAGSRKKKKLPRDDKNSPLVMLTGERVKIGLQFKKHCVSRTCLIPKQDHGVPPSDAPASHSGGGLDSMILFPEKAEVVACENIQTSHKLVGEVESHNNGLQMTSNYFNPTTSTNRGNNARTSTAKKKQHTLKRIVSSSSNTCVNSKSALGGGFDVSNSVSSVKSTSRISKQSENRLNTEEQTSPSENEYDDSPNRNPDRIAFNRYNEKCDSEKKKEKRLQKNQYVHKISNYSHENEKRETQRGSDSSLKDKVVIPKGYDNYAPKSNHERRISDLDLDLEQIKERMPEIKVIEGVALSSDNSNRSEQTLQKKSNHLITESLNKDHLEYYQTDTPSKKQSNMNEADLGYCRDKNRTKRVKMKSSRYQREGESYERLKRKACSDVLICENKKPSLSLEEVNMEQTNQVSSNLSLGKKRRLEKDRHASDHLIDKSKLLDGKGDFKTSSLTIRQDSKVNGSPDGQRKRKRLKKRLRHDHRRLSLSSSDEESCSFDISHMLQKTRQQRKRLKSINNSFKQKSSREEQSNKDGYLIQDEMVPSRNRKIEDEIIDSGNQSPVIDYSLTHNMSQQSVNSNGFLRTAIQSHHAKEKMIVCEEVRKSDNYVNVNNNIIEDRQYKVQDGYSDGVVTSGFCFSNKPITEKDNSNLLLCEPIGKEKENTYLDEPTTADMEQGNAMDYYKEGINLKENQFNTIEGRDNGKNNHEDKSTSRESFCGKNVGSSFKPNNTCRKETESRLIDSDDSLPDVSYAQQNGHAAEAVSIATVTEDLCDGKGLTDHNDTVPVIGEAKSSENGDSNIDGKTNGSLNIDSSDNPNSVDTLVSSAFTKKRFFQSHDYNIENQKNDSISLNFGVNKGLRQKKQPSGGKKVKNSQNKIFGSLKQFDDMQDSCKRRVKSSKRDQRQSQIEVTPDTLETWWLPKDKKKKEKQKERKTEVIDLVAMEAKMEKSLESVGNVSQLSSDQLQYLTHNNEDYLREILQGKRLCQRHTEYKSSSLLRARMTYMVSYGDFSEDSLETIMDTLVPMFCRKGSKYLDYVSKVLLPELLVKICMDVLHVDHSEAERTF